MTNAHVCHHCDKMNRDRYVCSIDGREIADHAASHDCPLQRFDSRGAGDVLAKVIHAVTLGTVKPCGACQKRAETLNEILPL